MIDFKLKGAIFDIDDTLLDNKSSYPGKGLHERARLIATREVGERYSIDKLKHLTEEQNFNALITAPVHTLEAAVWNILLITGQADSEVINKDNKLLQEIVARKNELYTIILEEEGVEVPGATEFVKALGANGIENYMAIASMAIRPDVDLFLKKMDLNYLFPKDHVITKENVNHPKPNPEAFNIAFDTLYLQDSDRVFVCAFEDDPRGIMAARSAGLYTCAIGTRYSVEQLMALEIPPHIAFATFNEYMKYFNL